MKIFTLKIFFILLLITFISSSMTLLAQEEQKIQEYSIENCVSPFNPSKIESTKVGYQYWFVNKNFLDGRTIKMSVVKPHEATHPPHKHAEDEFFFILEGKAEFYLNGKTLISEGYTSFYCPSNSEHGIRNVGDKELKYLVIKKYELTNK